ncbi:MAG: calcium-binding protein [Leptolyngbyaceae cyanobacterium SM1_3_5]|nr:calcium-binding protein [Leptolyngbyaceae cyanobacterium SM1_3_5]
MGGDGIDTLHLDYSSLDGTIGRVANSYRVTDRSGRRLTQVNFANFERFTLIGTANSDRLIGAANEDNLQGGVGNDALNGEAGDDTLSGGLGDDLLNGGEGSDRLIETGDVDFTATNTTLTGLGSDRLIGIEQLVLTGGESNNAIDASAFVLGSVALSGLGGDDILIGGMGSNSFTGGLGNDTIRGNTGSDTVIATGNVNFRLTDESLSGIGLDTLTSVEQATLTGGVSANTIDASTFSGAVTLIGGAGNDTLIGATNSIGQPVSQYASSVIAATSEFGSASWSAQQVLGVPNVFNFGDSRQAWAAATRDGTIEQLTVGFATSVQATGTTIRQNWGNGFIRKVEVLNEDDTFTEVWQGIDSSLPNQVFDFRVNWTPTAQFVKVADYDRHQP